MLGRDAISRGMISDSMTAESEMSFAPVDDLDDPIFAVSPQRRTRLTGNCHRETDAICARPYENSDDIPGSPSLVDGKIATAGIVIFDPHPVESKR